MNTVFIFFGESSGWVDLATAFLCIFAVVAACLSVILITVGLLFEFFNARHPERKIQKNRTNKRKWKELAHAPGSIAIISFCFTGGLFAQAMGWTITPWPLSWWASPLLLGASIVLYDAWFYWIHRLLHCKPFYRFHALHHKSVAPTVWTNHHETFTEAFLNQAFYLIIPFILPIAWPILVAQKLYDQISGMVGHAGYEHFASPAGRRPFPLASTVFHDQHHGHFAYNYGHTFSVWDRMMGTLYPKYDETLESFEDKKPQNGETS
ncbi:sterol desaturase/sphingolipid hydroxylase (fatty acid hydroxylase superfamily) [Agrobacterium vitis]|nr:sterol desaturase/sphingolipid hydroxylase (fatty acid hydroxylase superfamily) [Agrobacterium vitis]MBE1438822.1 sterol desaturase/sphingolipid hydroxylase (fatty acid hydroxylase superfamily) [Agrobacterium vitis]